jgi:D-glycero-D-manno-heptose 1,7-bisphosphate phosphatase
MNAAVFLDRDGVLIEDVDWLTRVDQLRILPGVPVALKRLREAGFQLVVITNQAVVARGLASEADVEKINDHLDSLIQAAGAPPLDAIYFCPHHPNATLPAYRVVCDCRKPAPGMLVRAAREHDLALPSSFVVGDRLTDILAGVRAGCRTVLVQTGKHTEPLIETGETVSTPVHPDHTGADLPAAADWILSLK